MTRPNPIQALAAIAQVSALAAALTVTAARQTVADTIPQRHERASSWRTVVIPAAAEAAVTAQPRTAAQAKTAPLETAALHKPGPAATAQPRLLGPGHALDGIASYYWQDQMTASGERFNKRDMTAAHPTLPFGTRVRVTHAASGRSVIVRINDRGPFKKGRVIDLSEAAAQSIGMTGAGLAHVRLVVVAGR